MPASRSLSVFAVADREDIGTNEDDLLTSQMDRRANSRDGLNDRMNFLSISSKGPLLKSSSNPNLTSTSGMTMLSPYVKHAVSLHPSQVKKTAKKKRVTVTANLAATKYGLVKRACLESGMVVTESPSMEDCLLIWSDSAVSPETISDLKSYQKINHFPGMGEICRKDSLARNLGKMARSHPDEYKFFPRTWVFPGDYSSFNTHYKDMKRKKKSKTYIVKPANGAMGHGIWLTKNVERLHAYESYIVQEYLDKPLLMDGYKFDLRLYVLVTSCDPLRIFLFNDGLVRMTTEKYQTPSEANLGCQYMHLTNYSINKHSESFINTTENDLGTKRTLSHLKQWISEQDESFDQIWSNISDVIVKTLLAAEPHLFHAYHMCRPSDISHNNSVCFEILGFDILLDRKFRPWIIEINRAPSFGADQALDFNIKRGVLVDALRLLDIRVTNKRKRLAAEKAEARSRLTRPLQRKELEMTGSEKRKKILERRKTELRKQLAQIRKDAALEDHEKATMGSYRRIYPPHDCVKLEKYKSLLDSATKTLSGRTASRRGADQPFKLLKEHELLDLLEEVENDESCIDSKGSVSNGYKPLSTLPSSKSLLRCYSNQETVGKGASSRPSSTIGSPSRTRSSSSATGHCRRPLSYRSTSSTSSIKTANSVENMKTIEGADERTEELSRQTFRALNSMRIKFPGKSDEEADKLLQEILDNWKFHKPRVATYWLVKLDATKRRKVIDIVQGNVRAILQRIWKVSNLDGLRLNRFCSKLFNRLLWSHGQGLWTCFNNVGDSWESIFNKNAESVSQMEMNCCRRVVQLCKDCLLVVYQFASESRITSTVNEVDTAAMQAKTSETRPQSKNGPQKFLSTRLARLYKGES